MKRTIHIGTHLSGGVGIAVDTMSYLDLGEKTVNERIGSVLVDAKGTGVYYPERESRYALIFRKASVPVYDDVGNPDNWVDRVRHAIPEKPVLHAIRPAYDVRQEIDYDAVWVYWHLEENRVKSQWNVETHAGDSIWRVQVELANTMAAELRFPVPNTTYSIRVQGVNKIGQTGTYSNVITYTTGAILRSPTDTIPPAQPTPVHLWEF